MKASELVSEILLELNLEETESKRINGFVRSAIVEAHQQIMSISKKHYLITKEFTIGPRERFDQTFPDVYNLLVRSVYFFSKSADPYLAKPGIERDYTAEATPNGVRIRTNCELSQPFRVAVSYFRSPILPPDSDVVDVPLGINFVKDEAKARYHADTGLYEIYAKQAAASLVSMLQALQVHSANASGSDFDAAFADAIEFYEDHI